MLDEFLTRHLEDIEYEFMRLSDELLRAAEEETKLRDQITAIMEQQDVGLEIFSPRSSATSAKEQIAEIRKHIDELQYQQAKLSDQIAANRAEEERYQHLLMEARKKAPQTDADVSRETSENDTDQVDDETELSQHSEINADDVALSSGSEQSVQKMTGISGTVVPSSANVETETAGERSDSDTDHVQSHENSASQTNQTDNQQTTVDLNAEQAEEIKRLKRRIKELERSRNERDASLKEILRRVERILSLHTDRVKSKNELKNLRYYLKALITDSEQ